MCLPSTLVFPGIRNGKTGVVMYSEFPCIFPNETKKEQTKVQTENTKQVNPAVCGPHCMYALDGGTDRAKGPRSHQVNW